ncbi:hypothetical protein [Persephonella sp.]
MKEVIKGIVIIINLISALVCFYSFTMFVGTLFSVAFGLEMEKGIRFLSLYLGVFLVSGVFFLLSEDIVRRNEK